ncbi:hypothetical protein HNR26_000018 [Rhizobium rosettiformans]|uniref:Uncharacterized protein n=2 Tax=Rhizobium rosettiformans TaxID=1368430 RepID=A0A4S8Q2X5_9HYPH|nr:hypothetical protein [Rhizobium rosettiformans]MBB5273980.1 hypothetical protein [Rhizobium rosettiformans]THV38350.1 hypothetical protein FAA86_06065 [Rhizobium rosettiformans W3]
MEVKVINMRRSSGIRLADFDVDLAGNTIRDFGITIGPNGEPGAVPPKGRDGPLVRLSREAWSAVCEAANDQYDKLAPDDAGLRRVLRAAERVAGI